jgi:hypothetical protein
MADSPERNDLLIAASVEALRKLLDERDRRYEDRFTAMDTAVTKAEVATEKRFDSMNEFRGTLSDQAATLMPRAEALSRFKGYDEQISELKNDVGLLRENQSRSGGKESAGEQASAKSDWNVGIVIAIVLSLIASAISAAGLFLHH